MQPEKKDKTAARLKKTLGIISTVILIAMFLVLCTAFISRISGKGNGVFGFHVNVIVTGSMEPDIKVGDIILSRSYHGQRLEVGDVVTFVSPSGEMKGKLITHEIVSIEDNGGELVITTKGKASLTEDEPIGEKDIVSVMVYKTVVIKYLYKVIRHPVGFVLLIVLPLVGALAGEIYSVIKQLKSKEDK